MDCSKCETNDNCQKPYESDHVYQVQYLGRTFTKEEWDKEGECPYFKAQKSLDTLAGIQNE